MSTIQEQTTHIVDLSVNAAPILGRIFGGYKPPENTVRAQGYLANFDTGVQRLGNLTQPEIERAREALQEQAGEVEVAEAYFGDLEQEIQTRLNHAKTKTGTGNRIVYRVDDQVLSRDKAREAIASQVLEDRYGRVLQTRDDINPGGNMSQSAFERLAPEDKGRMYAAEVIIQAAAPLVVAEKTGAVEKVGKALADLAAQKDNIDGLSEGGVRNALDEVRLLLPDPELAAELPGLIEQVAVVAGLYSEAAQKVASASRVNVTSRQTATDLAVLTSGSSWDSAPLLAREVARAAVVCGHGLAFRPLESDARTVGAGSLPRLSELRIDALPLRVAKETIWTRIHRIFIDRTQSPKDFDEVLKVYKRRPMVSEADRQRLGLLEKVKHFIQLTEQELMNKVVGIAADRVYERADAGGQDPWIIEQPEFYAMLDDDNLRVAMAKRYDQMRNGQYIVDADGSIYRVAQQAGTDPTRSESYDLVEARELGFYDVYAMRVMHSLGVHPNPYGGAEGTEQRALAWAAFDKYKVRGHEAFWRLYPHIKWARAGQERLFLEEWRQATGSEVFTLELPDPRDTTRGPTHPRQKYLVGDIFMMRGIYPADFVDRQVWVGLRSSPDSFLKNPTWFWHNVRKAVATAEGFSELFEEGSLRDFHSKVGAKLFDYIANSELRRQILRPFYKAASNEYIRDILMAVRASGTLTKDRLYQFVQQQGLGMLDLAEQVGIYFTAAAQRGSIEHQLPGIYGEYLKGIGLSDGEVATRLQRLQTGALEPDFIRFIFEKTGIELGQIRIIQGAAGEAEMWTGAVGWMQGMRGKLPEGVVELGTDQIPGDYSAWRELLEQKLLKFADYKGPAWQLLSDYTSGEWVPKNIREARLAEILTQDPVYGVWRQMIETAVTKNYTDFLNWAAEVRTSKSPIVEAELEGQQKRLVELRRQGALDEGHLQLALTQLKGMYKLNAETFVHRLSTIDGLVHQRWPTVVTAAVSILGNTIGKIFGVNLPASERWETFKTWAGTNPLAFGAMNIAGVATVGMLWFASVPPVVITQGSWAGAVAYAPSLGTIMGVWAAANIGAILMTDVMHIINEKFYKFTNDYYKNYLFRPRAKR